MNDTETKAPTDPAPWCSMCTNFAVCGNVADPRWSYRGHPFCDGCGIDGSSTADEINAADKAVRLATDAQSAPPDTIGFVVMLWPDANEALQASIEASLRRAK